MKLKTIAMALMMTGTLCCDTIPDLGTFKDLSRDFAQNTVLAENFDGLKPLDNYRLIRNNIFQTPLPFKLAPGISLAKGAGVNGTTALCYERKPGDDYYILTRPMPMEPGVEYECTFRYRCENIDFSRTRNAGSFKDVVSCLGIQFWQPPYRYLSGVGSYVKNQALAPGEWATGRMTAILPPNQDAFATCDIFLREKVLGRIYIDDIHVRACGRTAAQIYPLNSGLRLEPQGTVRMFVYQEGTPRPLQDLRMLFNLGTQTRCVQATPTPKPQFKASFPNLPPGPHDVQTLLLDIRKREIIAREQYRLHQPHQPFPTQGKTVIDEYGRTLVDGKPFLPLAIFSGFTMPPTIQHLKLWKQAGFNALMYYHPIKYLFIDGHKKTRAETIIASLDKMQEHDIKMIFCLFGQHTVKPWWNRTEFDHIRGMHQVTEHVVNLVKNHPAMLAYYLSDENSLDEYPNIRALRQRIGKLDSWHPTVTLTNTANYFARCCKTGDILSWDYYPVRTRPVEQQTMSYEGWRMADLQGLPHWFTPQAMCWLRDLAKGARPPELQELRASCYAALIHNVKGFMFYSYPSIVNFQKQNPDKGRKFWQDIQTTVQELRQLSPWILSLENTSSIPVINQSQSKSPEVIARAFSHRGKLRVLVVTNGPGKTTARFKAKTGLTSKYGLCKEIAPGTYEFNGNYVTADLLEN